MRRISRGAAKLINWDNFDAIPSVPMGELERPVLKAGGDDEAARGDDEYVRRVREAFDRIRSDFDRALSQVSKPFNRVMIFAVIAIVLAFAASLALALYQAAVLATLPNIAGAASIFALMWQYRRVLQDQKYLLIPARYELALTFCRDRQQVDKLVAQFLDETKPHENKPDAVPSAGGPPPSS